MTPSNKVQAAAAAAAVTTLVAWLLQLAGVPVPAEVQGALTTALVFLAGYFVSDKPPGRYQRTGKNDTPTK